MLQKGLKGVVAVETFISHIDGENGQLIYRGHEIGALTESYSFEEVAYLLWFGHLPDPDQLHSLKEQLKQNRNLPIYMKKIIDLLPPELDLMGVIRTAISAEGGYSEYGWKPTISQAIRLTAITPTIIAYRKRRLEKKEFISPLYDLDHVENYLYMLTGELPNPAHVKAL